MFMLVVVVMFLLYIYFPVFMFCASISFIGLLVFVKIYADNIDAEKYREKK